MYDTLIKDIELMEKAHAEGIVSDSDLLDFYALVEKELKLDSGQPRGRTPTVPVRSRRLDRSMVGASIR